MIDPKMKQTRKKTKRRAKPTAAFWKEEQDAAAATVLPDSLTGEELNRVLGGGALTALGPLLPDGRQVVATGDGSFGIPTTTVTVCSDSDKPIVNHHGSSDPNWLSNLAAESAEGAATGFTPFKLGEFEFEPRSNSNNIGRGSHTTLTPKQTNLVLRYHRAMQLRIAGLSYPKIAAAIIADPDLRVSPSYNARDAYFDVQGYLNELRSSVQDNLIDLVDVEAARLDDLTAAFWPSAMGGDTRAGQMILNIMERRSKMLGLDQAIKVDWRIELRQIERSGVLGDAEIREQLGDDLYAMYRQFSEEAFASSESPLAHFLVDRARNPTDYPKQGASQFGEFLDAYEDGEFEVIVDLEAPAVSDGEV